MNLDTLRLFCEIVRHRSFSKGARAMGVSQSAASQAVAQLEGHLDAILIDRAQRPFALTPEGRQYHEGVQNLLAGYDRLAEDIQQHRTQVTGEVRVAAIYSIGLAIMSRVIQQFMTRYPQAKIRTSYLHPHRVVDAVTSEDIDLGLISYPAPSRTLNVIPLRDERMVFVCPPGHPLATKKKVEARMLDGLPFVAFDPELAIRRAIDKALRARRTKVNVTMEFDNTETIKQALEIGAGVTILPEPTVEKEIARGSLVAVPLAVPELVRPIGVIHRRKLRLPLAVQKFIELLTEPSRV